MQTWSVKQLISFLKGADLEGPGVAFYNNGAAGADFLAMPMETLTNDLGLSAFAARKVLAARSAFLEVGAVSAGKLLLKGKIHILWPWQTPKIYIEPVPSRGSRRGSAGDPGGIRFFWRGSCFMLS